MPIRLEENRTYGCRRARPCKKRDESGADELIEEIGTVVGGEHYLAAMLILILSCILTRLASLISPLVSKTWPISLTLISVPTVTEGEAVDSHPRTLDSAFGQSDFTPAFWGNYNTIPIDSLPLHLLEMKVLKYKKQ